MLTPAGLGMGLVLAQQLLLAIRDEMVPYHLGKGLTN